MESKFCTFLFTDSMDNSASARRFFNNSSSAVFEGGGGSEARPFPLSSVFELPEELGAADFEEEELA